MSELTPEEVIAEEVVAEEVVADTETETFSAPEVVAEEEPIAVEPAPAPAPKKSKKSAPAPEATPEVVAEPKVEVVSTTAPRPIYAGGIMVSVKHKK